MSTNQEKMNEQRSRIKRVEREVFNLKEDIKQAIQRNKEKRQC